jgi:hypothetical protein
MNLADLQKKLLNAARQQAPSDTVPYAFEKRIMSRLVAAPLLDHSALWARALWRATAPCFAVMMLLAAWAFFEPPANSPSDDLSQALENTVFAAGEPDAAVETVW